MALPDSSVLFTAHSYRTLGESLMVSLLDVFGRNPYSRVYNSRYKSMDMLRRVTAYEIFHSAERFRMFERSIFGKVKNINSLLQDTLYSKPIYRGLFGSGWFQDAELNGVEWPRNVPGLTRAQAKIESGWGKEKRGKGMQSGSTKDEPAMEKADEGAVERQEQGC